MIHTQQLFEPYKTEPYSDFTKPENSAAYKTALEKVRKELGRDYPLIIGGEKIETGEWLESINPCNLEQVIGRTAKAKSKEIEKAFNRCLQSLRELVAMEHGRTLEDSG
jgi:1-pyrroline-5-carboxylate dehydrogenase